MADWDPFDFDNAHADFTDDANTDPLVASLCVLGVLAALAALEVVVLITALELAAGVGIVYYGGRAYVVGVGTGGVNPALVPIVEAIEAGTLTINAAMRIHALALAEEGFISVDALLALYAYDVSHNAGHYWHMGWYLGSFGGSGGEVGPGGGGPNVGSPGFGNFTGGGLGGPGGSGFGPGNGPGNGWGGPGPSPGNGIGNGGPFGNGNGGYHPGTGLFEGAFGAGVDAFGTSHLLCFWVDGTVYCTLVE